MEHLQQYRLAQQLEAALGDPRDPNRPMSFAQTAAIDEAETFPEAEIAWLYEYHLQDYYVPTSSGGKFTSFEEFVAFVRVLSRRDLNIAIAFTTMFWSFLTWMAGSDEQKATLSHRMQEEHLTCVQRVQRLQHQTMRFGIIITFLMIMDFLMPGGVLGSLGFSLYVALLWGLGLSLKTWRTLQTSGERYERDLNKWRRKRSVQKTINGVVDRFLGPT